MLCLEQGGAHVYTHVCPEGGRYQVSWSVTLPYSLRKGLSLSGSKAAGQKAPQSWGYREHVAISSPLVGSEVCVCTASNLPC